MKWDCCCPICGSEFYGRKTMARHLEHAHHFSEEEAAALIRPNPHSWRMEAEPPER